MNIHIIGFEHFRHAAARHIHLLSSSCSKCGWECGIGWPIQFNVLPLYIDPLSLSSFKRPAQRICVLRLWLDQIECSHLHTQDLLKSPGQTDSQVDASFGLAFYLSIIWPPTCVDLHLLETTSVDLHLLWSSSNLDASRCMFLTVWPPSTSQQKWIASNLLL